MTKPETRAEMAEWIAEELLGCTYCKDCEVWVSDIVNCKGDILKFAYSPDGFFAVINLITKSPYCLDLNYDCYLKYPWGAQITDTSTQDAGRHCPQHYTSNDKAEIYDALYSAVYDAWPKK